MEQLWVLHGSNSAAGHGVQLRTLSKVQNARQEMKTQTNRKETHRRKTHQKKKKGKQTKKEKNKQRNWGEKSHSSSSVCHSTVLEDAVGLSPISDPEICCAQQTWGGCRSATNPKLTVSTARRGAARQGTSAQQNPTGAAMGVEGDEATWKRNSGTEQSSTQLSSGKGEAALGHRSSMTERRPTRKS